MNMYCTMDILSINHRLVVLYRKNKRMVEEERVDTMMATLKKEKEREADMNKQVETKGSTRGRGHVVFIHPNFKGGWFVQKLRTGDCRFHRVNCTLHSLTDTQSPQVPPFQIQPADQIH
jgi:hypothetical protein